MPSPLAIGTTPVKVVPINRNRVKLRIQNVGNTTIYFKRGSAPSTTDYEIKLDAGTGAESNEANFETDSQSSFFAISGTGSSPNGGIAIFETTYTQPNIFC